MALLLAHVPAAQSADVYWDNDATADGNSILNGRNLGGTGNWDTSLLNWWNGSAGSDQAWVNANNDTAVFWGTAGTVTISTPITVGGLKFNTTGYTLSNGANTLSFQGNAAITLNNVAAATINGTSVSGTGNVTISGGVYGGATAGIINFSQNTNTGWSGTTTLNNGMTLQFNNQNKVLANTTGITFNGGTIYIASSSGTQANNNRINNAAPITANGGTFRYQTMIDTDGWNETIGSVALTSGQFNVWESFDKSPQSRTQTVYLSGLTHTGASNTSAITFAAAGAGLQTTYNRIVVTGAAQTPAGRIVAPWATTGTTPDLQTDYAVYDASACVLPAAIAASAENTWTTAANAYTFNVAPTLTATRTIAALRNSGGALTLALGASNYSLETYGLLNGGSGLLTVSTSGSGALTTPTGGGNLYLTTGNNAITVSAPINDNGGAVTLVKSGAGDTLTLSSSSTVAPRKWGGSFMQVVGL